MLDKPKQNEPDQNAIDTVNLSRLRAAQESHASETGSLRAAFAKAEMQGLDTEAAKRTLRILKGGSEAADEFLDYVAEVIRQCALMGITVERTQLDLFHVFPGSAPENEKAEIAGRLVGLAGGGEDENPHAGNTKKGMAWLTGFRSGAAERSIVMSMQPKPPAPPAAEPGEEPDDED